MSKKFFRVAVQLSANPNINTGYIFGQRLLRFNNGVASAEYIRDDVYLIFENRKKILLKVINNKLWLGAHIDACFWVISTNSFMDYPRDTISNIAYRLNISNMRSLMFYDITSMSMKNQLPKCAFVCHYISIFREEEWINNVIDWSLCE
jgi:hypothetical protein